MLLFMRSNGQFSTTMNIPFFKQYKPSLVIESLMHSPWTYVVGAAPFCILVAPNEGEGVERLDILAETNDGFEIAEADLRLRKAGVLAGTTQAGANDTIGNIVDDFALYMQAKGSAEAIVAEDPELATPEHQPLRALIDDVAAARALLVTA